MPETATAMDSTTPSDGSEPELLYRVVDGVATLSINLTPTMRGQYSFEIWVADLTDLESNHLSGVFKVD